MKKTVCLIQPVQSPYWTDRLAELAKSSQFDIVLLLERESFAHRPGWQVEPVAGIKTIILGSYVSSSKVKHKDLDYHVDGVRAFPWRLSRILMDVKPDVVVACNATQLIFALPARLIMGFHLALIVEDTPHTVRNLMLPKFFAKKWLYRRADSWLPFSRGAESFLVDIGIKKDTYTSSWSVDTNRFKPLLQATPDNGKYTISIVSALIPLKGIMPLLEEWARIPKSKRENFELKIAGSGPLRESIEQFLKVHNLRDVSLLGQIGYDEVRDLFQRSSLFVLPTLQDVWGLTVLEAMACGCPVITTQYAGARDLVEEGVNGWIADPLEKGELAICLANAMSDVGRLQIMGENARQKALDKSNKTVMNEFAKHLIEMGRL